MEDITEGIDLLILMMLIIAGLGFSLYCLNIVRDNTKPYTMEDKTSIRAITNNYNEPYQWTVRDYLLMLMVADDYCPQPKCVDLKLGTSNQDTRMFFNDSYVANLEGRLQKYYINYVSTRMNDPIVSYDYYYEGEGENGRWRFVLNR